MSGHSNFRVLLFVCVGAAVIALACGREDPRFSTSTKKGLTSKKVSTTLGKLLSSTLKGKATATSPAPKETTSIKRKTSRKATRAGRKSSRSTKTPAQSRTSTGARNPSVVIDLSSTSTPFDYPDIVENVTLPEGMFEVEGIDTDDEDDDDYGVEILPAPIKSESISTVSTKSPSPSKGQTKVTKKNDAKVTNRGRKSTTTRSLNLKGQTLKTSKAPPRTQSATKTILNVIGKA